MPIEEIIDIITLIIQKADFMAALGAFKSLVPMLENVLNVLGSIVATLFS